MEKILKAKPLIKSKYVDLKREIEELETPLSMKVIRVGEDPASAFYVQNIIKRGKKLGANVELVTLDIDITHSELEEIVTKFNNDNEVDGIMIQKPLPKAINEQLIIEKLSHYKDVDGFHPVNLGKLMLEQEGLFPCTATACLTMIDYYGIETSGKNIVILGRSSIVGKPLANMLLRKDKTGNATVTVCHSRTKNLSSITNKADILIAAIGSANFVTKEFLAKDAIVLDVGINEIVNPEGKTIYTGDVDYENCFETASAITPVPGGIGSVTTYELFKNLLRARLNNKK
ncbi:MAG: hypothetical protein B6226_00895 [Candidatus Cloacimonetes bacterium 4572_65]|nr:MAG: hypothetical protein B6226_00895 [Candidatus Cloacimonetes bacterium 4572_65]